MSKRLIGRPRRYVALIQALEPDAIYTPASIAQFASTANMLDTYRKNEEEDKLVKQRIRIAMGRIANNHNFPDEGDGNITIPGQSPTPGWLGSRWQESYHS